MVNSIRQKLTVYITISLYSSTAKIKYVEHGHKLSYLRHNNAMVDVLHERYLVLHFIIASLFHNYLTIVSSIVRKSETLTIQPATRGSILKYCTEMV